MVNNMWDRAGTAYAAGAPIGASVNIAQSTTSTSDAQTLGSAFYQAGATPNNMWAVDAGAQGFRPSQLAADPTWLTSFQKKAQQVNDTTVGFTLKALDWLNAPVRFVGDYAEAKARINYNASNGTFAQRATNTLGNVTGALAFLDPEFRKQFSMAQQAQASPAQTLWLGIKSEVAPDATAPQGDPFALLDDPNKWGDREEYFAGGLARWVTGAGDLAFNFTMDPLIVGGKAAQIGREALTTIHAADVTSVMSSSAATAGRSARRLDAFFNRVVDASESVRDTPGGYASLSSNVTLTQGADSGAIITALRSADSIVDDAARIQAKKEIIAAGMGHRPSIEALQARNDINGHLLSLEVESMVSPNQADAIYSLLARTDRSHLENLRDAHQDDWTQRLVDAHRTEIENEMASLERVIRTGAPAGVDAGTAMGEINTLALRDVVGGTKAGEMLGIGKTIQHSLGLPPVHVLFGRKIPGTMQLAADDAYDSFGSAVMRAYGVTRKNALPDEAKSLLDDFASSWTGIDPAASNAVRRKLVDRLDEIGTQRVIDNLVAAHGNELGRPQIAAIVQDVKKRRVDEMLSVRERAYRALDTESSVGWVHDTGSVMAFDARKMVEAFDGNVPLDVLTPRDISAPFAGTQLDQFVTLHDYKQVQNLVRRNILSSRSGLDGWVHRAADGTFKATQAVFDVLEQAWKFGALFRPGYVVRNLVDTQSRDLALIGMWRESSLARQALGNARHNLRRVPTELVDYTTNVAALRTRLDDIETILAKPNYTNDALRMERADILRQIDDLDVQIKKAISDGLSGQKVRLGKTDFARHIGLEPGNKRAVFDTQESYQRALSMNDFTDSIIGLVGSTSGRHLGAYRLSRSGQFKLVAPSNPLWEEGYLNLVNRTIRNDKGLLDMLAGASRDDLVAWYTKNPEGLAIWKGLADNYAGDLDAFLATMRSQLDTLVPAGARSRVLAAPIKPENVGDIFAGKTRPAVPANLLDATPQMSVERVVGWLDKTRTGWFKIAGEIPEEQLGRMPFFVHRARAHMDTLWPKAADGTDAVLTLKQANEIRLRAHARARRDVGHYLFDTSQRSNLAAHMRIFSPFYGAWSDTMRKWARIFGYNPASFGYGVQAIQGINSGTIVVDSDGNRILRDGSVLRAEVGPDGQTTFTREVVGHKANPFDGYIVIPVPDFIAGAMGSADNVKIAKNALNVTFQGDPFFLPSPGPLAAIPANTISNNWWPELTNNPIGRYLLPYGPEPDASAQYLPTWVRNGLTLRNSDIGNSNDSRVAQTYAQILAAKVGEINRGEVPAMSQKELLDYADNATQNWWAMRFLSNWFGFTAQPGSKLEFYQQEYRRMRREYGDQADEKFLEAYPDYYEATISLSVNETGIQATDDTWANSKQYADAINRNPQYGWAYVGAANMAPGFSEGVYTAQQAEGWRSTKDPVQAFNDLQVNAGWREYNRVNNAVQEELARRKAAGGPGSLTANANADLKQIRDQFIVDLSGRVPQWANEFEKGGSAASVNEFFRWAADAVDGYPELGQRSDFVALGEYLKVRSAIRAELDKRGLATVDSQGAEDLAEVWASFTTDLQQRDLGFQQMYTRAGLDRDNVPRR